MTNTNKANLLYRWFDPKRIDDHQALKAFWGCFVTFIFWMLISTIVFAIGSLYNYIYAYFNENRQTIQNYDVIDKKILKLASPSFTNLLEKRVILRERLKMEVMTAIPHEWLDEDNSVVSKFRE
ncbi:hypothetical protein SNEBB_011273 [Seison nebaliae]|nr:hypothetical protein SNEBB_011273 [Seison nebaliae]